MSVLSAPHFHNEAAAIARLEEIVWPQGPHCPRCGGFDRITDVKGGRAGLRRCGPCKREFTVTVGTIFERSHVKLHIWFQAAHLMASSKKGISAHQLHRTLKVTYKTAWFMEHRLREAMRDGHFTIMGGEGKTVEVDETYIGGKEKNKHRSKRNAGNIGGMGKEIAFSLVERGGKVRSQHIASVTSKTLREALVSQLHADTKLMTDDAGQYRHMHKDFAHEVVNHGIGEYVRGDAHTNTIEGYFSILKRGITGTYHHVSPQHLKRYLAEFDFRYNERMALGVSDEARATKALRGIVGKRLTYRDS
ncbi:IS1595 family transposase [Bradyrhizobium sp. ISRA443]|uniref:IS1595 family transposase n=1 Tax=unclassified Bradyrhizobium TaxID=2631580 RepID=UPI00247AF0F9|nr:MULTISPECIES: IS1595 family transposase [unclassified Bradyrhizobium]WGS01140.1 IS1595 family transposase [Bradyrhizobium sp. ISRA436]WGS08027.1 IS1595 family transposase [Bradyrhizobium sp. ISRA437]WGS14915.1 IS1595 family transposase [Bradyrhizobium sp. ISRA443]